MHVVEASLERRLRPVLDDAHQNMVVYNCRSAFTHLLDYLGDLVADLDQRDVRAHLQPLCLRHPITRILHQDPFSLRSWRKPRGYAGDAPLIDYLYGLSSPPPDTTSHGSEVFAQNMARPSATSVRTRRGLTATTIDEQASAWGERLEVLSLACGHLREVALSAAVSNRHARITAFDQDVRSVEEARRACASLPVEVRYGSVRQALTRSLTSDHFHFVYAAGLYDYLADATAARLTARLFELVLPGGRLFFGNFLPGNVDRGYMETYMDWYLHYRTTDQIRDCLREIPEDRIASSTSFVDPEGRIGYCEVTKQASP